MKESQEEITAPTVILFVCVLGAEHSLYISGWVQVGECAVVLSWNPCGVAHIKLLTAYRSLILGQNRKREEREMKGSKRVCDVERIKHTEKVYYQQQSYPTH